MVSSVNWRAMFLALMSPVLPSIRLVSTQPSAVTILQKVLRIYVASYPLSTLTSDSIIYLEVSNIWLVRCMSTRILFLRLAFSLWYLSFLTFLETGRSRDHHSEPDVDVWGIGHNSMQPRLLLTHIFWFPVSFNTFFVSSHVPRCNWISFMFCSSMSVPQHLMRNNICQRLCVSILQSFLFRISSPGNYLMIYRLLWLVSSPQIGLQNCIFSWKSDRELHSYLECDLFTTV